MLTIRAATYIALLPGLLSSGLCEVQTPLSEPNNGTSLHSERIKIAIIGAGIAGATAAYYLQDSIRNTYDVDITIFESESQLGGRIQTIKYRDAAIEVGAPSATVHDMCFLRAMEDVGLAHEQPDQSWKYRRQDTVGTWNGEQIINVRQHDSERSTWLKFVVKLWKEGYHAWLLRKIYHPDWVQLAESMWRYGLSPWKVFRSSSSTMKALEKFPVKLPVGRGSIIHNISSSELQRLGLDGKVLDPASAYLQHLNISRSYQEEFIHPLVRARFGHSLGEIRGIAAEVAVQEFYSQKVDIADGNYRLVERLIMLSKSELRLHSRIRSIWHGKERLYSLTVESTTGEQDEEFDVVVIAAPFSFNNIAFKTNFRPKRILRDTDYKQDDLHITHFATDLTLSPSFFNLPPDTKLPTTIYTTANTSLVSNILSITIAVRTTYLDMEGCSNTPETPGYDLEDCDTVVEEKVYRITSSTPIDDSTLTRLVHQSVDYIFPFVHRQVWPYTVPGEGREPAIDATELAPNMFYTGGFEDVLPSLEMSCRMGKNAATQVYWSLPNRACW